MGDANNDVFTAMSRKDVNDMLGAIDQNLQGSRLNDGDLTIILQFLEEIANANKDDDYAKAGGGGVSAFLSDVVKASNIAISEYGKKATKAVGIIDTVSQRKDLDCVIAKVILQESYLLSKRNGFKDKLLPAVWVGRVDETIANNPYISEDEKNDYLNDKRCNVYRGVVAQKAKDYNLANNNMAVRSLGSSVTR